MPILAKNHKKHTPSRKKSHTDPLSLLPDPTISNKGPDANLLQHPLEIVTQGHQVEFATASGQTTHQEMVYLGPALQGSQGMFDQ